MITSREIKFRAWDKINKEFDYFTIFSVPSYLTGRHIDYKDGKWNNRYIITEFTGLKDKAGIEIYEGDILKYKIILFGIEHGEVIWNKNCWTLTGYEDQEGSILAKSKDFEIIGNIYEDSNLLENAK